VWTINAATPEGAITLDGVDVFTFDAAARTSASARMGARADPRKELEGRRPLFEHRSYGFETRASRIPTALHDCRKAFLPEFVRSAHATRAVARTTRWQFICC